MKRHPIRASLLGALFVSLFVSAPAMGQDDGATKKKGKKDGKPPGAAKVSDTHHKTFNQEDWGSGPDGKELARKLLKEHFEQAFPRGLTVGLGGKGRRKAVLVGPKDVSDLLPLRGDPAPMKDDGVSALKKTGGLGGQLVAAKLNVGLDAIGELGHRKKHGETPFADLLLRRGYKPALTGLSVRELIRLGDRAIAGKYGEDVEPYKKVVDVDRDGDGDASLMDLRDALSLANSALRRGHETEKSLSEPVVAEDDDVDDDTEERKSSAEERRRRDAERRRRAAADDEELEAEDDREVETRREERRRRAEEQGEDADEEGEREVEQAEEERDREVLEADRERDRALDEVDRIEDKKRRAEQRKRALDAHRVKVAEIDAKFAAKKVRIERKFEEKHGRPHPGRGRGLDGEHPGRGKGSERSGADGGDVEAEKAKKAKREKRGGSEKDGRRKS